MRNCVAFRQGGAGVLQNKLRRVGHEVFGADDFAAHLSVKFAAAPERCIRSRNAIGRAFRDSADDNLRRDRMWAPARFASRSAARNVPLLSSVAFDASAAARCSGE